MIIERITESFFSKSLKSRNSKASSEVEDPDMSIKIKLRSTVLCCVGSCVKEVHHVVDGGGIEIFESEATIRAGDCR